VYQGFLEEAKTRGWQVVALQERFEIQLRDLINRNAVDAAVGDFISERWVRSLPRPVPVVQIGVRSLADAIPSVSLDECEIGHRAADHFKQMGYEEGLYYSPRRSVELCDEAGFEWIRNAEALRDRIRSCSGAGVLCASDYLARQGLRVSRSLGLEVPEQIGFAGIGNQMLEGLLSDKKISSFPIPYTEIGRTAVRLLADRILHDRICHVQHPPSELLVRESSGRRMSSRHLTFQVRELLHGRLADPPPVEEWARRLGMSRRSFERAFAAETGVTPYEYLLQWRTGEARRLLTETDWTIARVGEAVGVPDPPRFSAFFRSRCGMTAADWRKQSREEKGG